jgi:hypothetical protein
LQKTGDAPNSGDFFGSSGKEGKKKKGANHFFSLSLSSNRKGEPRKREGPRQIFVVVSFFPP